MSSALTTLFVPKTKVEITHLSPDARRQYLREAAWWEALGDTSRGGDQIAPGYMPSYRMRDPFYREVLPKVQQWGRDFRASRGVDADAVVQYVTCSVARAGKVWRWLAEVVPFAEASRSIPERYGESATREAAYADVAAAGRAILEETCGQVWTYDTPKGPRAEVLGFLRASAAGSVTEFYRQLNIEKRKARPASSRTDAQFDGLLVLDYGGYFDDMIGDYRCIHYVHRITRVTAKRIYFSTYTRAHYNNWLAAERGEDVGEIWTRSYKAINPEDEGFVDRKALEDAGPEGVRRKGRGSRETIYFLKDYQQMLAEQLARRAAFRLAHDEDLAARFAEAKAVMVAAHPDKGGSHEAFIKARKAYEDLLKVVQLHAARGGAA